MQLSSRLQGVPRSQEPPPPSLGPTVGLYLGHYSGPRGWAFLMSEVPLQAHGNQSGPISGPGFEVKVLETLKLFHRRSTADTTRN
jgi:hypothetical protein